MHRSLKAATVAAIAGLGVASGAQASTILFEDFADSTVGYTLSATPYSVANQGFFGRIGGTSPDIATTPTGFSWGTPPSVGIFAVHDDTSGGNPKTMTFSNVNIQNATNLNFSIYFSEDSPSQNDNADFIHVDYSIDGGAFQPLIWLETSADNAPWRLDANFNGVGDGATALGAAFTQFSNTIAGSGNLMTLRITMSVNGAGEDVAFDDLLLTGDIPEPATAGLLGLAGLGLLRRRRRA